MASPSETSGSPRSNAASPSNAGSPKSRDGSPKSRDGSPKALDRGKLQNQAEKEKAISEMNVQQAIGMVKVKGGQPGVGLWVQLCDHNFILTEFTTITNITQATQASVVFPEYVQKAQEREISKSPVGSKSPTSSPGSSPRQDKVLKFRTIAKREVKLAPKEFFMVDREAGFTVVAVIPEDEKSLSRERKPIAFASNAASATWPAPKDRQLQTVRYIGAFEPIEEIKCELDAAPGKELKLKLAERERLPSGRVFAGVPVFEPLPDRADGDGTFMRQLKLVGFTKLLKDREIKAVPAVHIARAIEAQVAMDLFNGHKEKTGSQAISSKRSESSSNPNHGMKKARDCLAIRRCAARHDPDLAPVDKKTSKLSSGPLRQSLLSGDSWLRGKCLRSNADVLGNSFDV